VDFPYIVFRADTQNWMCGLSMSLNLNFDAYDVNVLYFWQMLNSEYIIIGK